MGLSRETHDYFVFFGFRGATPSVYYGTGYGTRDLQLRHRALMRRRASIWLGRNLPVLVASVRDVCCASRALLARCVRTVYYTTYAFHVCMSTPVPLPVCR